MIKIFYKNGVLIFSASALFSDSEWAMNAAAKAAVYVAVPLAIALSKR